MPVLRQDRNQVFDMQGNLLSETLVDVDVTVETNLPVVAGALEQAMAELVAHRNAIVAARDVVQAHGPAVTTIKNTASFTNAQRDAALNELAGTALDVYALQTLVVAALADMATIERRLIRLARSVAQPELAATGLDETD